MHPSPKRIGEHFNAGTDMKVFATLAREIVSGHLLAWDLVAQKERWRHPYAMPWNGGTLTTAGNLVFQATTDGRFLALSADAGRLLWEFHTGPITWSAGGVQDVTVVAGWGGAFALADGDAARQGGNTDQTGRVFTFALYDQPITPAVVTARLESPPSGYAAGEDLYHRWCARCHGSGAIAGGAGVPDLRHSAPDVRAAFAEVVTRGKSAAGMPAFDGVLSPREIESIRTYVAGKS